MAKNWKVVVIHSDMTGMNILFARKNNIDQRFIHRAFCNYLDISDENENAMDILRSFVELYDCKMLCDEDDDIYGELFGDLEDGTSIEIVERYHERF